MVLEEGDIVLCTVDRIVGTVVFVKIHSHTNQEGSIILSEIAPGRIRNLRDYVVPKKKIVCKVLSILPNGNIFLSLRRVTQEERKKVLEEFKQEKSYSNILISILGKEKASKFTDVVKENVYQFLEEAKKDRKKLDNLVGIKDASKILEIISKQKKKKSIAKKEFGLTSSLPDGIEKIKKLLKKIQDTKISYISAGKYLIKIEDTNLKNAGKKLKEALSKIEAQAKKEKIEFSIKNK